MGNYLLEKESEDLILAVIKNDCPTCQLLIPTLDDLGKTGKLTVVLQDEIDFPSEADWVIDDRELEVSWNLNLDSVPTLLHFKNGEEVERTVGWSREEWRKITGNRPLGTIYQNSNPVEVLLLLTPGGSTNSNPNLKIQNSVQGK